MAYNILKTLIPLLSSSIFILLVANTAWSQTINFYYDFYGEQPTDLIYQGDAHFPSDTTYLRLTRTDAAGNPMQNSFGRVVYPTPIPFWAPGAQVDFETTVKFIIRPVDNNPADGFVFFIAPVGTNIPGGSLGENFGVFDSSNGPSPSIFAVEFDTFVNAAVDPNYRHIGIDIEYLKSVNTTRIDDETLGVEVTALIAYIEATSEIRVTVTTATSSYEVNYLYDLSTVLNQQVQVGLAASTGGSVSVHDVIAWYFTATVVHKGDAAVKENVKIRQYV